MSGGRAANGTTDVGPLGFSIWDFRTLNEDIEAPCTPPSPRPAGQKKRAKNKFSSHNILWAGPYSTSMPPDNHQRQHFRNLPAVFLPVFVEAELWLKSTKHSGSHSRP